MWKPAVTAMFGFILVTEIKFADVCILDDLQICERQFKQDASDYNAKLKTQNFTMTEKFNMICRIFSAHANCSYPKIAGCYKKDVEKVDKFFEKWKSCKIETAAERGFPILPNPTNRTTVWNGSCDTSKVAACVQSNKEILNALITKYQNDTTEEEAQRQEVCREGERFSNCLYSNVMGCTQDYITTIDNVLKRYNQNPHRCTIVLSSERDFNGSITVSLSTQKRNGGSTSYPGIELRTNNPNLLLKHTCGNCSVRRLDGCDSKFESNTIVYNKYAQNSNISIAEKRKLICRVVDEYANCSYPNIDGCYEKTFIYVDEFFTQYAACGVPISFQRELTYKLDRSGGHCNTSRVNKCIEENKENLENILQRALAGNYSVKQQRLDTCSEGTRLASCIYASAMSCIDIILMKVDKIIVKYNHPPYLCDIALYKDRHQNGSVIVGSSSSAALCYRTSGTPGSVTTRSSFSAGNTTTTKRPMGPSSAPTTTTAFFSETSKITTQRSKGAITTLSTASKLFTTQSSRTSSKSTASSAVSPATSSSRLQTLSSKPYTSIASSTLSTRVPTLPPTLTAKSTTSTMAQTGENDESSTATSRNQTAMLSPVSQSVPHNSTLGRTKPNLGKALDTTPISRGCSTEDTVRLFIVMALVYVSFA